MAITRAPSLVAGVSTNPNTLTRSLVRSYDDLAQGVNFLAEVFSYGDLRPVGTDDLVTRWDWTVNTSLENYSTIKDSMSGLDGTSIYTYAANSANSLSFLNLDNMFIVENLSEDGLTFNGEKRPATIYESFLNMKTYIDTQVSTNLNPLLSLTSSLEAFLSAAGAGAANGTVVVVDNDEFSLSSWKLTNYGYNSVTYPAFLNQSDTGILVGDDTFKVMSSNFELLGGPSGGSFIYDTDGLAIDTVDSPISFLTATDIVLSPGVTFPILTTTPSNPPTGHVKLYYSDDLSALRLRKSDGTESAIGGGGAGDTGDITFSGVKIIGAGMASGDGGESGTIELVPDNDLYGNDQYLIIDPTGPNHIHIRPGGTQDSSNSNLILGAEKSNVTISDTETNRIRFNVKTSDNIYSSTWSLEAGATNGKGTLNFPGWLNSQSYTDSNGSLIIATEDTGIAWTGSKYHSTIKLIIQGEYLTDGIYQVQSCEVLLARSSGTVVSHVTYGVVCTHDPLFTVTSSVDGVSGDTILEVNNLAAGNLYISTFTTTIGSRD